MFAVPEARMVAGMVVGVAAQDVEHEPSVQLVQRRLRRGEAVPNDFREDFIAGVTRHHLIENEQRQRRDHRLARPVVFPLCAVESLDQQHVLAGDVLKTHGGDVKPRLGSKAHGDIFRLHHVVGVGRRRELGDHLRFAVQDHRLRARAAERRTVVQRLIEVGRQRLTFLDFLGGAVKLFDRRGLNGARYVLGRGVLEVQSADAVGAGLQ